MAWARPKLLFTVTICCLAVVIGGCARRGRVVDSDVGSGQWSRDGQALYYMKYDIYRYDVNTRQKRRYDMRNMVAEGFRLSPDERKIVLVKDGDGLFVGDLQTGHFERVYSTKRSILNLYWPQPDTIVFCEDVSKSDSRIYLLDPATRSMKRFPSGCHLRFGAIDGSGFLYMDSDNRYRFHDLDNGTDKVLPLVWSGSNGLHFIYLDKKKLIYNVWRSEYQGTAKLDLATMRTRYLTLPDPHSDMRFSPDLERYWYSGPHHQDTQPLKLYLVDTPPDVIKQLKAPVK